MCVVDVFEVVEINEHHGTHETIPLGLAQRIAETVCQQTPVRQTRQHIKQGKLLQLDLGRNGLFSGALQVAQQYSRGHRDNPVDDQEVAADQSPLTPRRVFQTPERPLQIKEPAKEKQQGSGEQQAESRCAQAQEQGCSQWYGGQIK